MTVLVAICFAVITTLLLVVLGRRSPASRTPITSEPEADLRTCPLCGSVLKSGQRVHSVVFATKTQDKLMEISGCPHCRPPATLRRVCPVCKKDLRPQDLVTARVFERQNETGPKRTHVHVLGCPRCRRS